MIKFPTLKSPRVAKLEQVNNVLLHCIVALMKIDDEPRIKESQLILKAVKSKYEAELKIEKQNDQMERSSKKNTP